MSGAIDDFLALHPRARIIGGVVGDKGTDVTFCEEMTDSVVFPETFAVLICNAINAAPHRSQIDVYGRLGSREMDIIIEVIRASGVRVVKKGQ